MQNPFARRTSSLAGPATDLVPVTPSNSDDLPRYALALYIETGGTLRINTIRGEMRQIQVADFSLLPVGVRRVHTSGTTAQGIHALTL